MLEVLRKVFIGIDLYWFTIFFSLYFSIVGLFLSFLLITPTKYKNPKLLKILCKITYFVFIFLAAFILLYFALVASWLKTAIIAPLFCVYLISLWKLKKTWNLKESDKKDDNLLLYSFIVMFILGLMNTFVRDL